MSFVRFGSPARNAQPAVAETPAADAVILPAEPAPAVTLGRAGGGVPSSSPASVQLVQPIPIRTVPRAAIEALVVRLMAQGFRHIVTVEGSPYGR